MIAPERECGNGKFSPFPCFVHAKVTLNDYQTWALAVVAEKQGRIHGNLAADGWAGAVIYEDCSQF